MNRRLRPTKSTQQIKEEEINFLLEDLKKKIEKYKKATELKDKQLSEIKKILQGAKKSYSTVVNENTELKKYVENIKQRFQQYQKQQQEYFNREREDFRQKQPKKYKKVVHQEESASEPELEESQYVPEETEDEMEKPKIEKN